jgi:hypothetical protein
VTESIDEGPFLLIGALAQKVTVHEGQLPVMGELLTNVQFAPTDPEAASDQMPPLNLKLYVVVVLVAGQARGQGFTVALKPEGPFGGSVPRGDVPITFPDHEHGVASVVLTLDVQFQEEGVHWFDVFLAPRGRGGDERLLTKLPLEIGYHQTQTSDQG